MKKKVLIISTLIIAVVTMIILIIVKHNDEINVSNIDTLLMSERQKISYQINLINPEIKYHFETVNENKYVLLMCRNDEYNKEEYGEVIIGIKVNKKDKTIMDIYRRQYL